MFGKTRELNDTANLDGTAIDGFFGDESAVAEAVQVDALHHRVAQVELQINSQFTSLATYAQIAQEQIELARAEAKTSTERSEHRLTELIERERADRMEATQSSPGVVSIGAARSAMDERLDNLERSVAQIKITLEECFAQQLALADAIHKLFAHQMAPSAAGAALPAPPHAPQHAAPLAAPSVHGPADDQAGVTAEQSFAAPVPGPIPGLSLNLGIA